MLTIPSWTSVAFRQHVPLVGKTLVEVDPKYFRPAEVEQLLGDPTKAKTLLGWNPRKTSFEQLVKIMTDHDMKFVRKLYLKSQI